METIVAQQLTSYLQDNKLNEMLQSSYKKHQSVETALSKVQSDSLLAADKGLVVVLVLLHLSAAFDTIDQPILLHRLENRFGVRVYALSWLVSYLSEIYQCIQIGSHLSSKTRLLCGVPQGYVLGPLLFAMYITPLCDIIRKHDLNFHMYADDMLYISFRPGTYDQAYALDRLHCCLRDVDA